jgi:hypothetical protein
MNHGSCVYLAIVRRFQSVIHNRVDISGTQGASPATGKTWGIWESLMLKTIIFMLRNFNTVSLHTNRLEQMTIRPCCHRTGVPSPGGSWGQFN